MEETLGKRIAFHRKRLGLTQDALASALGVTAQAVSKWENDQSCPDITMLPKLSEVFGVTTDALLGLEKEETQIAEVIPPEDPDIPPAPEGAWEVRWDRGRKSSVAFAVWVLLLGGLALLCTLDKGGNAPSLWTLTWTTGLLVFGLAGLHPKFQFFRLGCALFGGYFLLFDFGLLPFYLEWKFIIPVLLLLFGLSLLLDALRKPAQGSFQVSRNGKLVAGSKFSDFQCDGDTFSCATGFGSNTYPIDLPRLAGGKAEVSFGEMTVDLRGCGVIADGASLALDCSFGQLNLLLPRFCRATLHNDTAFGSVEINGEPDPDAAVTLCLKCVVSFGQIRVQYL